MRQFACLVFNQIMVDNYAAFFYLTPVGRASDSLMAPDLKLFILDSRYRTFLSVAWRIGVQLVFFFCSGFPVIYLAPTNLHRREAY